ncbi:MAG: hypothetical protein R3B70_07515 [Polyangiaceae bacterium]
MSMGLEYASRYSCQCSVSKAGARAGLRIPGVKRRICEPFGRKM